MSTYQVYIYINKFFYGITGMDKKLFQLAKPSTSKDDKTIFWSTLTFRRTTK